MKNKKITIDYLTLMMKKGFGGVDEKMSEIKIDVVNSEVKINKKLEAMEERWSRKFDKLTTTMDRFLKD